MPLTEASPMRSPVKEPGPAVTAKPSTSERLQPQPASSCSAIGRLVAEWV